MKIAKVLVDAGYGGGRHLVGSTTYVNQKVMVPEGELSVRVGVRGGTVVDKGAYFRPADGYDLGTEIVYDIPVEIIANTMDWRNASPPEIVWADNRGGSRPGAGRRPATPGAAISRSLDSLERAIRSSVERGDLPDDEARRLATRATAIITRLQRA